MNQAAKIGFVLYLAAHMPVFAAIAPSAFELPPEVESSRTAQTLIDLNTWIIPQPKSVDRTISSFDLKACRGIRYVGAESADAVTTIEILSADLTKRSNVPLVSQVGGPENQYILLGLFPDGKAPKEFHGISADDLQDIGTQGYALHIDRRGVTIAARGIEGLFYGGKTLSQIATDRTKLPGLHIRDWPSLPYRGILQDICRTQMPTMETFKRLTDIVADTKMNILELYIEHTFKFKSHPDISPPEGLTPKQGRELFEYATRQYIDVHPMFQVLGHAHPIVSKPQYKHLSSGPCIKKPCTVSFDIRKPETIAFITELVDELCETFPGKYLCLDICEFNDGAFLETEKTPEGVLNLIYKYVLQLNEMVKRHGMRLMITQGPLDFTGHIVGLAPILDKFPKDIMIVIGYTAGGCFQPAWKKDFPRLAEHKVDFITMPWIYSHSRIMPQMWSAMAFSDLEVGRGMAYGAKGSITADWADRGNFHLTGQTWYPFVYHGASAWTGAQVDRRYFDHAFTRLFYGIEDDSVARAIHLAGNINVQPYKIRNAAGKVVERQHHVRYARLLWTIDHFLGDPFTNKEIAWFAEPGQVGEQVVPAADKAVRMFDTALTKATRNRDNIVQLLFAARCFQAMGRKLITLGHYNDAQYNRETVADEFGQLVTTYEELQSEYKKLWLAEDRENDNFHRLLARFNETIDPFKKKILELRK